METKICNRCGIEKDLYDFYKQSTGYRYGKCIQCIKEIRDTGEKSEYRGRITQGLREWCETKSLLSKMGYNIEMDIHTQFIERHPHLVLKSQPAANKNSYKLSDCDRIKKPHSEE